MSFKRQAPSELNHENWNDEDPEDDKNMGQFKAASKDVLEKRVIRTARRRNPVASEPSKSVFSAFGGFNKAQPTSFDFLANLTNGSKNTNGATNTSSSAQSSSPGLFTNKPTSTGLFGAQTSASFAPQPSQPTVTTSPFGTTVKTSQSTLFTNTNIPSKETPFKIQAISQQDSVKSSAKPASSVFGVSMTVANDKELFTSTPIKIQTSSTNTTMVQTSFGITVTPTVTTVTPEKKTDGEQCNEKKIKYFSKLKGLNEAVSDWISKHVAQTPLCILSPIFKDYEKYLKEITEEYQSADKGGSDDMDTENPVLKTQNINTKIPPFDKTGPSLFSSNNETMKPSGSFGVCTSNASPKNGTSNHGNKITSSFGVTNPSSSTAVQSTKMSSPFGIDANKSSSNTESTKISPSYAVNNTISSPLPSSKTSSGVEVSLRSPETKTSPFASVNSNASPFNNSPSSGNPKPVFGAQNNLPSSPENKPNFSFGINTSIASMSSAPTPSTGFSFGVTSSAPSANTSFTISTNVSTNQTSTAPFSFGTGKPFSFSPNTIAQQPTSSETTAAENEDEEPPKVEYTPVKEDNCVYEKKCKIFVKKDGNFVDKGVGTLYVKKIEGNVKHQLLVRANTNLGTVLLNLVLAEAIPTQRMGKNNVMLVCIPTPDSKPPPTPILIRVKTAEEADEVLETLNKYKA